MSNTNKLSKEVLNLSQFLKDTVRQNVTNSFLEGKLQLNELQLKSLLSLIDGSIDQGTQKGLPSFQRTVKLLDEENLSSKNKR
jgi:hypothetical protein